MNATSTAEKGTVINYRGKRISNTPRKYEGTNVPIDFVGYETVPLWDSVIDSKGGKRDIRFLDGCKTIWYDEQVALGYPNKQTWVPSSEDRIEIVNGRLKVDKDTEPIKYEYLEHCNYNGSNKKRLTFSSIIFYLDDQEQISKELYDHQKKVNKVKSLLDSKTKIEIDSLVTRINNAELVFQVAPTEIDADLRLALGRWADKYPEAILDLLVEKNYDEKIFIAEAINEGVILYNEQGQPKLKGEEKPFVTGVTKANKITAIIDFFTTPEGMEVKEKVQSMMKKPN